MIFILFQILLNTPEGHPDHNHLREALEHCQELCSQVNEGVREKENSDRLEWIQQHVHCDGLPEVRMWWWVSPFIALNPLSYNATF